MSDKSDLLAISASLNLSHCDADSELKILGSIVDHLKKTKLAKEKDVTDNGNNFIPDSLAFPEELRKTVSQNETNGIWDKLEEFNSQLRQDHQNRRQMLLDRLDCTVESFKWKGAKQTTGGTSKDKSMNDKIHDIYENFRVKIKAEPMVTMANLLAVRETECDQLLNGVISSRKVDCQVRLNSGKRGTDAKELVNLKRVLIPSVPDRGGRPEEVRPPVKETYAQQRRDFSPRGRGGSRGRR